MSLISSGKSTAHAEPAQSEVSRVNGTDLDTTQAGTSSDELSGSSSSDDEDTESWAISPDGPFISSLKLALTRTRGLRVHIEDQWVIRKYDEATRTWDDRYVWSLSLSRLEDDAQTSVLSRRKRRENPESLPGWEEGDSAQVARAVDSMCASLDGTETAHVLETEADDDRWEQGPSLPASYGVRLKYVEPEHQHSSATARDVTVTVGRHFGEEAGIAGRCSENTEKERHPGYSQHNQQAESA